MRRRDFIAGIAGATVVPIAAQAQQGGRIQRIGVLIAYEEGDPTAKGYFNNFTQELVQLGWTDGRNVQIDVRWAASSVDRIEVLAKEIVSLVPDVILADTTPVTAALQRETQTIPIVFMTVSDPVGSGFIAGLPRPGGNITGFINHDASMAGKWLELLTEIAPGVKRAAMMFNPDTAPYVRAYYQPSFEAAAQSLKVEPIAAPVRNDAEIKSAIGSLGREPRGGLVVMPDVFPFVHRAKIIKLTAQNHVPSISVTSDWVREGGLLSYGADIGDLYRRAATYVNRILRGANRPIFLFNCRSNFKWS